MIEKFGGSRRFSLLQLLTKFDSQIEYDQMGWSQRLLSNYLLQYQEFAANTTMIREKTHGC